MSTKMTIPPELHSAFKLFVAELEKQLEYLRSTLSNAELLTSDTREKERVATNLHRIRGAAGFLGLDQIRQDATEAEKLFNGPEYRESNSGKVLTAISRIEAQHSKLQKAIESV